MSDTAKREVKAGSKVTQWLANPFRFIAGFEAMALGVGAIAAAGVLGWLGNTHFDGVLDVHVGLEAPLWVFLAEGAINWLCLVVPLYFFGLIFSQTSFRFIDVLGTQALARWPYLVTALVMLPAANTQVSQYIAARIQGGEAGNLDVMAAGIFAAALIVTLAMTIWSVVLMYRAYAVSCNIRGLKAGISFTVALLGAEIMSKALILKFVIGSLD